MTVDLNSFKKILIEDFANYMPLENNEGTYSENKDYHVTTKWYPNDTQELFNKHLSDPTSKSLLYKLGWSNKQGEPVQIEYNLNVNGFRCKNTDTITDKGLLFLGCSHTFGVGLHEEQTFAHRVSSHFGKECFNYGLPGKGLDVSALYTMLFLQDDLDISLIDAVVVFTPPLGRINYSVSDKVDEDTNIWAGELLALNSIKYFCLKNNLPLVIHNKIETISSQHDWARDIGHYGPQTHNNIACDIISKLEILIG
jgi:hypothetical protein